MLRLVEQGKLNLDADVSNTLGWKLRNPAFPDAPQRFPRILEVVGSDDASKATARQRYRRYLDSGFEIHHHNMSDARHD